MVNDDNYKLWSDLTPSNDSEIEISKDNNGLGKTRDKADARNFWWVLYGTAENYDKFLISIISLQSFFDFT